MRGLAASLVLALAACGSTRAAADIADASDDAGPGDAGQPFACGAETCSTTQACVTECSGVFRPEDAGPLPSHCVEVPPACRTSSDCNCFGGNPCPTGMCVSVDHGVPLCLCA